LLIKAEFFFELQFYKKDIWLFDINLHNILVARLKPDIFYTPEGIKENVNRSWNRLTKALKNNKLNIAHFIFHQCLIVGGFEKKYLQILS
jgi:hypothetical protein